MAKEFDINENQPHKVSEVICLKCLHILQNNSNYSKKCPKCNKKTLKIYVKIPRNLRSMIQELELKCLFFSNGCKATVKYEHLLCHIRDCYFRNVMCCNMSCKHVFPLDKIVQYGSCRLGRLLLCPLCKKYVRNYDFKEHMKVTCPELRSKCNECGMEMLNKEVDRHVSLMEGRKATECVLYKLNTQSESIKNLEYISKEINKKY